MKRATLLLLLVASSALAQVNSGTDIYLGGAPVAPTNRVPVTCDNCGNGGAGASATDASTFTAGSSVFVGTGGVYNDALVALATGKWADFRMTANRALHINLRDATGAEIGTSGSPVFVNCTNCSGGGAGSVVNIADPVTSTQKLAVDAGGKIGINNFPATQPISAASLPLPSNAAQETGGNLATIVTNTGRIPSSPATDRTTAAAPAAVRISNGAAFDTPTTPADTQPVSCSNCSGTVTTSTTLATDSVGLAKDATLTGGSAKTQIVSGGNTAGVNASGQIAVQNAPNIDVALSTRLKPADTLTKVTTVDTITNPVAVTNANLDATLSTRAADASVTATQAAAAAGLPSKAQVVAGSDYGGTPAVRLVKVDGSGNLYVVAQASGAVIGHVVVDSGTLIATQSSGANLHVNVDSAPTTAVTNAGLSNIPADPAREGGNLATVATNTNGVAKDSSLTTLDTDMKATQPRDVTDRAARQLGAVSAATITASSATWTNATAPGTCVGPISMSGMGSAAYTVAPSGTVTGGTITPKVSFDGGSTYAAIQAVRMDTTGGTNNINTPGAAALYAFPSFGNMTNAELCVATSFTGAGSSVVLISASAAPILPMVAVSAIAQTVTTQDKADQVNGGVSSTISLGIGGSDGTNQVAARMKAAGASAATTDPSLVVALSPNSPLPPGANMIGAVVLTNQPPAMTASQLANPILYRAAMSRFCASNLCTNVPLK